MFLYKRCHDSQKLQMRERVLVLFPWVPLSGSVERSGSCVAARSTQHEHVQWRPGAPGHAQRPGPAVDPQQHGHRLQLCLPLSFATS